MIKQFCVASVAALTLTGCITMDGNMVHPDGRSANCTTKGGGLGIGMVIGAAAAAVDNQLCESKFEKEGFVLAKDVGKTGLVVVDEGGAAVVKAVVDPAKSAGCVDAGDKIVSVEGVPTASAQAVRSATFKKAGASVSLGVVKGSGVESTCSFKAS